MAAYARASVVASVGPEEGGIGGGSEAGQAAEGAEGAGGGEPCRPAPPLASLPGGLRGWTPPAMAMSCGVQWPPTYTGSCAAAAPRRGHAPAPPRLRRRRTPQCAAPEPRVRAKGFEREARIRDVPSVRIVQEC
jgi:hypothetical protein